MSIRSNLRSALLGIVAMVGTGLTVRQASAAAFQDGGFEDPVSPTVISSLTNPGGNPVVTMPGWVATSGSTSTYYQCGLLTSAWDHVFEGNQAVLFNGDGLARVQITQTFDTDAGTNYLVSFRLSAQTPGINGSNSNIANAHLIVTATGNAEGLFAVPTAVSPTGEYPYLAEQYAFSATGPSTTLSFLNFDGTDLSPMLDAVSVNVVPEPPMVGGLVVAAGAALGRKRRANQRGHANQCSN